MKHQDRKPKTTTWSHFKEMDLENGHGKQLVAMKTIHDKTVYIIVGRDSRTKPETEGWYPHPLIKGDRLSVVNNIDIFSTVILSMDRRIKTVNMFGREMEKIIKTTDIEIIKSNGFVPPWVMQKHKVSILLKDICCYIWIENEEKRKEMVDLLNYEEEKISSLTEQLQWTIKNEMVVSPQKTNLEETDLVEIIEIPFSNSISKAIQGRLEVKGIIKLTMGV